MAAELVEEKVAVILVRGPVPMQAAKVTTATIPIVMAASSSDPVGEGLIASFARPGGNITEITYAASAERIRQAARTPEGIRWAHLSRSGSLGPGYRTLPPNLGSHFGECRRPARATDSRALRGTPCWRS